MAGTIWEFFGYRSNDGSDAARSAIESKLCPILEEQCEKTFNDGVISGVCTLKPMTSGPVICCPIRLYANNYQILHEIAAFAFGTKLDLVPGKQAISFAQKHKKACVAVFGQRWGGELRLPQKDNTGGYFVDWVLARLDSEGELQEFIAVEVQTIDTTGTYRDGYEALVQGGSIKKTTAGLNWENVSKRILPQLIYKGQVLQREELCRKGLFFVCPAPVYDRISKRLGGSDNLIRYTLQPAAITFLTYEHVISDVHEDGKMIALRQATKHTTTVYKVQEAFNNVTLPKENVYQKAILKALGKE